VATSARPPAKITIYPSLVEIQVGPEDWPLSKTIVYADDPTVTDLRGPKPTISAEDLARLWDENDHPHRFLRLVNTVEALGLNVTDIERYREKKGF